jgi:hypothetical protein
MKIATRIAFLQFQANPADPSNVWRLIVAWITPGLREPSANVRSTTRSEGRSEQDRGAGGGDALQSRPRSSLMATIQRGIGKSHGAKLLAAGGLVAVIAGAFLVPSIWDNYQRQQAIERVAEDMAMCGWGYDKNRAESFLVQVHLLKSLSWSESADMFRAATTCGAIARRVGK